MAGMLFRGMLLAAVLCVTSQVAMAQSVQGSGPANVQIAQNDALQAAINAKDIAAIFAMVNAIPRDQRGPIASRLLAAANSVKQRDPQFAASLASMAFLSGGLNRAQTNLALFLIRNSPGGAAVVANLLNDNTTSCTACFGFALDGTSFSAAVAGENPNHRSAIGNPRSGSEN